MAAVVPGFRRTPFTPAVGALAAACLCPRTAAVATTIFVVTYGALLHAGILEWADVGRQFGWLYVYFVVAAYVGMLEEASKQAFDWLFPAKPAEPSREAPRG